MKRRISVAAVAAATAVSGLLLGLCAAPVQADTPPGAVGQPVVTHPVEEPFDYPAGEVCPFPSHADFPVSDLTQRTWYDAAGNPVFAVDSGPLVIRVTNLATGRTIERDISGSGTVTYPDPDSFVLSGGDWSAGFHTSDTPVHNHWIVSRGYMSVRITTTAGVTSRTLLALRGPYEDLCRTLA